MQQPPFHDPNRDPLPDANDVEAEFRGAEVNLHKEDPAFQLSAENQARLNADKRWMRNFIVGLLLAGLAIGGVLAIGLVWGMNRLNLTDPSTISPNEAPE
jgi:hypothetical protein